MWGLSLAELFERGGFVMWPLLAFSLVSLAIIIERSLRFLLHVTAFERWNASLHQSLDRAATGTNKADRGLQFLRGQSTPYAHVARAYLTRVNEPGAVLHEQVGIEASRQINSLERGLHWLSIIGTLAPMLGLLGTVMGLVEAFQQIEVLGGQLQPTDLASGIWKALLTTVYGLAVGLPTIAAYHMLDHRISSISLQLQWMTSSLNESFGKSQELKEELPNPVPNA